MKFYDCRTAPSPRRVRIFLREKGVSLETVEVDLGAGEQLTAAFRRKNPRCTVPVLELDDGTCLWETSAICYYLERRYPEPELIGRDAGRAAMVLQWNHLIEADGFQAVAEAFRNLTRGLQRRALTGAIDYPQVPALVERGRARAQAFFGDLDSQLAQRSFVIGDQFSMADITALVVVDFAKWIKLNPTENHVHLRRWYEDVSRRPSVQA